MKKYVLVGSWILLAALVVTSQSIPEAPAGVDGLTNGSVTQDVMDAASIQFQEIEAAVPNGVGPTFNDVSCVNCHQSQAVGGAAQVLELRAGHNEFSRPEWFREERHRGDTNGSRGTFVAATAITNNGTLIPNRSLINQRAICSDAQEHIQPIDDIRATRLALSLFGDAFVEAVPDATFLAIAKQNGGETIQVPVLEVPGTTEVGKFGWKDQHSSLLSFASDAYINEMGVTNPLNPDEATTVCAATDPSVTQPNNVDDIDTFTVFMRSLKVPPRGPITDEVNAGQVIFEKVGCASCHVGTMMTAPTGTAIHGGFYVISDAIGGKQIHPFGDYLLHNIGTGDGIVQNGPADTQYKVRTMPLWGLRTRTQLLHDATAATAKDAIERHRGEARGVEENFDNLSQADKASLLLFLGSL